MTPPNIVFVFITWSHPRICLRLLVTRDSLLLQHFHGLHVIIIMVTYREENKGCSSNRLSLHSEYLNTNFEFE